MFVVERVKIGMPIKRKCPSAFTVIDSLQVPLTLNTQIISIAHSQKITGNRAWWNLLQLNSRSHGAPYCMYEKYNRLSITFDFHHQFHPCRPPLIIPHGFPVAFHGKLMAFYQSALFAAPLSRSRARHHYRVCVCAV